jgi:hypothetical protein
MHFKCFGWEQPNNEIGPVMYSTPERVEVSDCDAVCAKNCRICLLDMFDVEVNCPGLSISGDLRFTWTVRTASRVGGTITCNLMPGEEKCPVCLLQLRRISKGC